MKNINLYCLPYAGGNSSVYTKWKSMIPDFINVQAIELPGHGKRLRESLITDFNKLSKDCYYQIKNSITKGPYALFGYSMGAWLIYNVYRILKQKKDRPPIHIFLAAKEPPHMKKKEAKYYLMSKDEFRKRIVDQGGVPEEISQSEELMDVLLPAIRADYQAIETYERIIDYQIFNCPITLLIGEDDTITKEEMYEWNLYSKKGCKSYIFRGDHFFINCRSKGIVQLITKTLRYTIV